MDLSKAFDTINHNILIKKLKFYGLDFVSIKWFKSYLENRKQFVTVNDIDSTMLLIETGVPQGSILGPLLFLIYLNDIQFCSDEFRFICFADDTTLILSICFKRKNCKTCLDDKDFKAENINIELEKIHSWLKINKLSLNVDKTKYMVFHNYQRNLKKSANYSFLLNKPSEIKVNEIPIERVDSHVFLGLTIQDNLSWNCHIGKIANKISKTIGIMKHIKSFVPPNILKSLYNSLIIPYLHYGVILWGAQCQRIVTLQKKCIRMISNCFPYEHTEKLFKMLGILKIEDIFKQKCLLTYYKLKKNLLPKYLSDMFELFIPPSSYSLRSHSNQILAEPTTNLRSTELTLRYNLPRLINCLSSDIIELFEIESIYVFKYKLKSLLISKYSDSNCEIINCYSCNQRLFFPSFLPNIIQLIHIYSYIPFMSLLPGNNHDFFSPVFFPKILQFLHIFSYIPFLEILPNPRN